MAISKKVTLVLVIFALLTLGITAASAQTDTQDRQRPVRTIIGSRVLINALADLTDVSAQEIIQDLEPGTTLNDLITAYDRDPADVVAQAESTITEAVNARVTDGQLSEERAATLLEDLNARLTELLDEPLRDAAIRRDNIRDTIRDRGERGLIGALVELTGQQPADLLQEARDNDYTTLAELAAAYDIEPADLVAAANAAAAARVEEAVANETLTAEQAEQIVQGLDEFFNEAVEADLSRLLTPRQRIVTNRPVRQLVLQEVSAATGLEPAAILQELQNGSTLAEILAAHDVDPDTIIDSISAELSANLEAQLQDMLESPASAN